MPGIIKVLFAADGHEAVHAAIRSLKREAQDLERIQGRSGKGLAANTNAAAREAARATSAVEKQAAVAERSKNKAATLAAREAKRAADAEIREANRAAQQVARIRENSARMAGQVAARQARQEQQALAKQAASRGAGVRGAGQMLGRSVRGTIGTVTGVAGSLGLAGGGMMIGGALMGGIELQRQAALLSNATSMPGAPGKSPEDLMKMATGTATRTGFKAEDVMGAMNVVSARAGGATGLNAMAGDLDDIAKTALASGVAMQDMGAVYAAALNAGVKPGQEMQQLLIDFVDMGKKGAVEFADLAGELAKLGGAGRAFGSGAGMLKQVVGLAQLAVQTDVSPEEARTTVIDMVREFSQGPKMAKLKAAGVDVSNAKTGKLNDPAMLLASTIDAANTKGIDGSKGIAGLSEIFTGKSAGLARLLNETYLAAEGKTKGSGKRAILDQIAGASATSMTTADRDREAATVLGTPAQQAAKAMEEFNAKIRELIPQFTALLPSALKAAEGLAKLAEFAANNPFTALGGIFAAHLSKELAGAGIAKMFETGIAAVLAGKGGGAGGNLAALGTIAMTATAVYLTGTKIIDEIDKNARKGGADEYANVAEAGNILRKVKGGTATADDIKRAGELTGGLQGNLEKRQSQEELTTKYLAPLLAVPGVNFFAGGAMLAEAGYDKFTAKSAEAGGGGQSKQDVESMIAALTALTTAAGKASSELNKVQGGSIANPGNGARKNPASSMATDH